MLSSHSWRVVNVAFVDQHLAADDFVAGGGVARKIDAAHEELLAFVDVQRQVDLVGVGHRLDVGLGHEIDVAELAVQLAQFLEALAQLGGGEHVALLHPEHRRASEFPACGTASRRRN